MITIDLDERTASLDVPGDELARRRDALEPAGPSSENGWLKVYENTARPLSRGATLGDG